MRQNYIRPLISSTVFALVAMACTQQTGSLATDQNLIETSPIPGVFPESYHVDKNFLVFTGHSSEGTRFQLSCNWYVDIDTGSARAYGQNQSLVTSENNASKSSLAIQQDDDVITVYHSFLSSDQTVRQQDTFIYDETNKDVKTESINCRESKDGNASHCNKVKPFKSIGSILKKIDGIQDYCEALASRKDIQKATRPFIVYRIPRGPHMTA